MQKNKSFLLFIGCVIVVIIVVVLLTKKSGPKIVKDYAAALKQKDAHKLAQLIDKDEGFCASKENIEEWCESCLKDLKSYKMIKQTKVKSKKDMEKAFEEEISDEEWELYQILYFENENEVYCLKVEINGKKDTDIVCVNKEGNIVFSNYLDEYNSNEILEQVQESSRTISLYLAKDTLQIAISEIQKEFIEAYAINRNTTISSFLTYSNLDSQLQKLGYKLCTETDINKKPSNMSEVINEICYFTDNDSIFKGQIELSSTDKSSVNVRDVEKIK